MKKIFTSFCIFIQFSIAIDHNLSMKYLDEGAKLYKNDNYVQAIKKLKSSIEQNSTNHAAYFVLGLCYDAMGSFKKDISDIKKALKYVQKSFDIKEENLSKEAVIYLKNKINSIDHPQYFKKNCSSCPASNMF